MFPPGYGGIFDPDRRHGAFLALYGRQFEPDDGSQALESPFRPGFPAGDLLGGNDAAHRQFVAGISRYRGGHHEGDGSSVDGKGIRGIVGICKRIACFERLGTSGDKDAPFVFVFSGLGRTGDIDQDTVVVVPGNGTAGEIDGCPGGDGFYVHGKTAEITVGVRRSGMVFLSGTS